MIFLANKGWTYKEMVEYFAFIESHQATEEEVQEAIAKADENGKNKN